MICRHRSSVSVIRLPQRSVTCSNGFSYSVCLSDPRDFCCLLRRGQSPTEGECENDSEDPYSFWIFDFGLSDRSHRTTVGNIFVISLVHQANI
jgi:hypothetical protein